MLLELKNIKKYFHVSHGIFGLGHEVVRAVDGVDLNISSGENLGLVGESGSGKTTLGRIILQLYPVDEGTIIFEGKDITHLTARELRPLRKSFQMVFQDPYSSLDPRYTVGNILREALELKQLAEGQKGLSAAEELQQMEAALISVGLNGNCMERFPHEFSGGERQRIAIARALLMNPKLLILDEAVSSLDVLIQQQIIRLLQDLQRRYKLTYLFISHNLRVIRKLCSRVAIMYQGKIVELGATKDIFENPLHPYTQELLAAAIEYKTHARNWKVEWTANSRLIDKGNGHFVID